jgi:SNF2 family DNA or RNA helicase
MLKKSEMHDYQNRMVDWIIDNQNSALWAEPGLGKTVCTLTALDDLRNNFEIDWALVIAPLRVSRSVWPKEIKRWEHLQHMTCENLYWPDAEQKVQAYSQIKKEGLQPDDRDSDKERIRKLKRRDAIIYKFYIPWLREKLAKRADFYTINREQVPLLCRVLYMNWSFDTVVIDEASSFKNHASQRFKGLQAIRKKIDRVIELTGTPASNGLMNIWAQIWLLDQGESLHRTISSFRDLYFVPGYNGFGWDLRPGAKEEIYQRVEHLCMTMLAKDYLELPPFNEIPVPLELPPKAQRMYDEMEAEFMLTIDDETVHASQNAALHNKLRQICNGAVYTDGTLESPEHPTDKKTSKNWKEVHNVKIDALKSIYEEAEGTPVLVGYNFKHDLARIQKAFPEARVINTPQDEDDWNAGKIPMGLGHPASMGHGLNLQYGSHIAVWFGLTWDLELYEQFNKRLNRQGQTHPVLCHILYVDLPAERAMKEGLKNNQLTQNELLHRMKKEVINNPGGTYPPDY